MKENMKIMQKILKILKVQIMQRVWKMGYRKYPLLTTFLIYPTFLEKKKKNIHLIVNQIS